MDKIKLSIVSPVYCESIFISDFVEHVSDIVKDMNITYEILLIDDGSTDDTWKHILKLSKDWGGVRAIRLSRNFGKEAALFAGIDNAIGENIITIDSDLQHPVELIAQMYDMAITGDANIIECVKDVRQKESFIDKFFAIMFYRIFNKLSDINLNGASDFKLLDRKAINAIQKMPEKNIFFRGVIQWIGLKHKTIYFTPNDRKAGGSKWSFMKKVNLAINSLTSYTAKPLLLIWVMTLVFFLMSLILGIDVLFNYIKGVGAVGFPTIILLVCITGSAILLALSLLSIYIIQVFNEAKGRPRYIISEVCDEYRREKSDEIK